MVSQHTSKIFVIGGTGAQGKPVIKGLVDDGKYQVRVLTRYPSSVRAQDLVALGNVELFQGSLASESTLRAGFQGCDGAFVNIDGFNTGEKTEMYWAIRTYEIAIEEGIKFFVYGNLGYSLKAGRYDSKFRSGHLDGKGRVGEWILWQNNDNKERMGACLFTTGPYIDMSISAATVMTPTIDHGAVTWRVPVGNSAVPFIALEDCGHYVRWLFDNPERATGMDLKVAIDHITFDELAAAFTRVTGHPAQYIAMSMEDYWNLGHFPHFAKLPAGYNADPNDPSTMSNRDNFTGFWNVFKHGLIKRDYAILDEIHPGRIRTAEEWFRREDESGRSAGKGGLWERVQAGNIAPVLKRAEDG
ncbi:hypothetical protein GE09DRAFT_1003406, partial [Coniochaeta sp. 2T2.1]